MKRAGGGSGSDDEEEDVHHTTASDILSFMPVIWPRRFPHRRQLRIWQIHSDEVSLYTHPRTQQMLRKQRHWINTLQQLCSLLQKLPSSVAFHIRRLPFHNRNLRQHFSPDIYPLRPVPYPKRQPSGPNQQVPRFFAPTK